MVDMKSDIIVIYMSCMYDYECLYIYLCTCFFVYMDITTFQHPYWLTSYNCHQSSISLCSSILSTDRRQASESRWATEGHHPWFHFWWLVFLVWSSSGQLYCTCLNIYYLCFYQMRKVAFFPSWCCFFRSFY